MREITVVRRKIFDDLPSVVVWVLIVAAFMGGVGVTSLGVRIMLAYVEC